MEFDYHGYNKKRKKEIDSIKSKYIKTKVIVPKKEDIMPLCCIVWQSGRIEIVKNDENKQQSIFDSVMRMASVSASERTLLQRGEADTAFDEAMKKAFGSNIVIGYLLRNQLFNSQENEYIFHYSKSGLDTARQMDMENAQNGTIANSFFNSFLFRRIFPDPEKIYVSRGANFPVFKEKLMALKNRSNEIIEESSRTGRSVLEISTSDISNDFLLIGTKDKDVESFYKEIIKRGYSSILAKKGYYLAVDDIDADMERKRAERELKTSIEDFVC